MHATFWGWAASRADLTLFYSNWKPKLLFCTSSCSLKSLSLLNGNGWNLVSRHIWTCKVYLLYFQSYESFSGNHFYTTKSFLALKVLEIDSLNFACPNIFTKCAWRPNFSHFDWEMTKITGVQLDVPSPTRRSSDFNVRMSFVLMKMIGLLSTYGPKIEWYSACAVLWSYIVTQTKPAPLTCTVVVPMRPWQWEKSRPPLEKTLSTKSSSPEFSITLLCTHEIIVAWKHWWNFN